MGTCPWEARRGQSPFTQDPGDPFWSPQPLNLILHCGTHVSPEFWTTVLFFSSLKSQSDHISLRLQSFSTAPAASLSFPGWHCSSQGPGPSSGHWVTQKHLQPYLDGQV